MCLATMDTSPDTPAQCCVQALENMIVPRNEQQQARQALDSRDRNPCRESELSLSSDTCACDHRLMPDRENSEDMTCCTE